MVLMTRIAPSPGDSVHLLAENRGGPHQAGTANVGDRKWRAPATKLAEPLLGSEAELFEPDRRQAAWAWVKE
jgi:hypothetical protein